MSKRDYNNWTNEELIQRQFINDKTGGLTFLT